MFAAVRLIQQLTQGGIPPQQGIYLQVIVGVVAVVVGCRKNRVEV